MNIEEIIIIEDGNEKLLEENTPDYRDYVIVSAEFKRNEDLKQQRRRIVEEINKTASEKMKESKKCYFRDENVLILWKNIKREKYCMESLGYSKRHLLINFSRAMKRSNRIYIENINTLSDKKTTSYIEILENLYIIWKISGIVPVFIQDDFLLAGKDEEFFEEEFNAMYSQKYNNMDRNNEILQSLGYKKLASKERKDYLDEHRTNARYQFMAEKNKEYFIRFFNTIGALVEISGSNIETSFPENFIDLYLKWQNHEITLEEGVSRLIEGSRATFYRYATNFEESPIYEEYTIGYKSNKYTKPKRGKVANKYEILLCYKEIYHLEGKNTIPYNAVERFIYEKFQSIHSLRDVYRHINAAEHSIKVLKAGNKQKLEAELKKYNITYEELDFDPLSYEKMNKKLRELNEKKIPLFWL